MDGYRIDFRAIEQNASDNSHGIRIAIDENDEDGILVKGSCLAPYTMPDVVVIQRTGRGIKILSSTCLDVEFARAIVQAECYSRAVYAMEAIVHAISRKAIFEYSPEEGL